MHRLVLTALLAVVLLAGCTSTRVINEWHEDRYQGPQLKRFLVIGLDQNTNRRRFFETEFSKQLSEAGIEATPGFRVLQGENPVEEEAAIEAAFEHTSADAILLTRLVGISREQSYIPPTVGYLSEPFYDHFRPTYRLVYHPGYTVTNTNVILETSVYSRNSRELLWTANTHSFNPSSGNHVVSGLASITVKRLRELGFLPDG